jgi:hypothetical protein
MSHSSSSMLAAWVRRSTGSMGQWLGGIRARPLLVFGFLVPLAINVYGQDNVLTIGRPLIIPLTAIFVLLGLLRGGAQRVLSTWRASPAPFWFYASTLAVEAMLMFYHDSPSGWAWLGGRLAFFAVLVTTVAHCDDEEAVRDGLRGLSCGVVVIAVLTVIRAARIVELPFGLPIWPARTFGPIRMPVPRTLGLAMSPSKFGTLAAVALTTALVGGDKPLIRPLWARAFLFCVVLAAAVISQARAVYITVLATLGWAGLFGVAGKRAIRWLASARGAWLTTTFYAVLLVIANVIFPLVAPPWIVDVGSEVSVANVTLRIDANAVGWRMFKQAPLFGIGHGTFLQVTGLRESIHNHFWEQVVATGIVGAIPYLLFHMWILVSALQLLGSGRSSVSAMAKALVVSVSATYLAYQFSPSYFTSVFAVLCGLVICAGREKQPIDRPATESMA